MKFVETSIFTRQVQSLLSDESYRELQASLMIRPDAGAVIKKTDQADLTPEQVKVLKRLVEKNLS